MKELRAIDEISAVEIVSVKQRLCLHAHHSKSALYVTRAYSGAPTGSWCCKGRSYPPAPLHFETCIQCRTSTLCHLETYTRSVLANGIFSAHGEKRACSSFSHIESGESALSL